MDKNSSHVGVLHGQSTSLHHKLTSTLHVNHMCLFIENLNQNAFLILSQKHSVLLCAAFG